MGLQGFGPLRCERVTDGRTLGMTHPRVNVVNPSGHGLHRWQIRGHQPLGNTTPMAQVSREPHPGMTLQPQRHGPGVGQAAAAMGFQHHGTGNGVDAIEYVLEKTMLCGLRPAVAADDQIDLERFKGKGTTQQIFKLLEMPLGTIGQIRGVVATSGDLQNQHQPMSAEQVPNLRCIQPLQAGMHHIAFETIKSMG